MGVVGENGYSCRVWVRFRGGKKAALSTVVNGTAWFRKCQMSARSFDNSWRLPSGVSALTAKRSITRL